MEVNEEEPGDPENEGSEGNTENELDNEENGLTNESDLETVDDLEENWATYLEEAAENIESYSTDIDMRNIFTEEDPEEVEPDQITLFMTVVGEFEQGYVELTDLTLTDYRVYYDGERWFTNEGDGWQEVEF